MLLIDKKPFADADASVQKAIKDSIKAAKEQFTTDSRKTVRIKYAPHLLTRHPKEKHNRHSVKPRSMNIPFTGRFRWIEKDNTREVEVTYYENRVAIPNKPGEFDYIPKTLDFTGDMVVHNEDSTGELLWFLYYCSHKCQNGKQAHRGNNDHWFYVENKIAEAKDLYEANKEKKLVDRYLYHDLTEKELFSMAKAMHIRDVDSSTKEEIVLALGNVTENEEMRKRFIHLITNLEDRSLKVAITEALDGNVIGFNPTTCKWHYLAADERNFAAKICQVRDHNKKLEELYEFFLADKEAYNDFMAKMKPVLEE